MGGWFASVCASTAMAGAISVSPTRIELSPRHPIATLEVRNEAADPVTVQLERMAWTQSEGQDAYAASAELIATPPVFELAPHGSQVIRVALRPGIAASMERAYRLYACEVPAAGPPAVSGVRMALRIGVPVFAGPADSAARLAGQIQAQPDGRMAIRLQNTGGHFTRALSVALHDPAGAVVWESHSPSYLLSGGDHLWWVDHAAKVSSSEPLRLSVVTETGTVNIDSRP